MLFLLIFLLCTLFSCQSISYWLDVGKGDYCHLFKAFLYDVEKLVIQNSIGSVALTSRVEVNLVGMESMAITGAYVLFR